MTIPLLPGTDDSQADFSSERLTLAREKRKLTKQQLADRCNVSRRTVTAWERGEIESPPVALLAEKLDFPAEYFQAGDPALVDPEAVSFRALSSTTARQVHSAMATASLSIELSDWIEQHYRLPSVDFPPDEDGDVRPVMSAEAMRRYWRIRPGPIQNMFKTLERRGVRIFSLPCGDREIDAFSFWREGKPYIFLNPDRSAERQRFDLAHELGHIVLHRGRQLSRSRAIEQQANDFASTFLVPADSLYQQVVGTLRYADIFKLKEHWRVSALAMVERLRRLDIITEWIHRRWIIELTQEGYRSNEPVGIDLESSQLLKEILEKAHEDGWTIARIAAALRINQGDLNDVIFGMGRAVIAGAGEAGPRRSGHLRRVQ
ncbi:helix-turn-helix domain-containing protein [Pseudonocardia saturnea]